MQCYTELTPPTAVTHSLTLPFVSADSNNLIIAKTSLLQIFTTKTISTARETPGNLKHTSANRANALDKKLGDGKGPVGSVKSDLVTKTKLVLIAEYTLSGTITSLARIKTKTSKSGGDSLLVGLKDAKLSLVEWDPARPGVSTISIHYYEQDEHKDMPRAPWADSLGDQVNYLVVHPGSRCAALKFGARSLAILPFRQGDEDIAMSDDHDEELDGPRPAGPLKTVNGDKGKNETPYGSSFVVQLTTISPSLIFPIHLAFLHEYREPTFGILSSTILPSASLLPERRDCVNYMVFNMDLVEKDSTLILSVEHLPYDLFKVIPLPSPIGGALLVGGNQLIHIDQGGRANGVAVNMFARQCSSFSLADQSDLEMRLEGCLIEQLSIGSGEMLIFLHCGELAVLSFDLDGRSVSGLSVRRVSSDAGGSVIPAGSSSASQIGPSTYFVGSEMADSVVLGWSRKAAQLSRRKSKIDPSLNLEEEIEEDEDDEDDDDLYGDALSTKKVSTNSITSTDNSKAGDFSFEIHDSLVNIAPMTDMTVGSSAFFNTDEDKANAVGVTSNLELVGIAGRDKAGSLAVIHRNIQPKVIGRFDFPEARGIWTVSAKRPTPKSLKTEDDNDETNDGADLQYDRLMIVSKATEDDSEESDVYALTEAGFEALVGTEFEPAAGPTIEAGTLGNGNRVIQVLKSEVRSYDGGKSELFLLYNLGSKAWRMEDLQSSFLWANIPALEGAIWDQNMSCSINESTLPTFASQKLPYDVFFRCQNLIGCGS
jgi:cleavage and polyadenylation specificity factor subunit 1